MKYLVAFLFLLCACNNDTETSSTAVNNAVEMPQQINLSILLDLSDRIDPQKNPAKPEHFERDSALIDYLSDFFLEQMKARGTFMAKGKMRVIFSPNPSDPMINTAAGRLRVDLSQMDTKQKKEVFETLKGTVAENIKSIYSTSINQHVWPGADIWRFFKNDVKEIAVDPDTAYRNILVIFTDGYIYHQDSKDNVGNRYAYLLPDLLTKYKLRNNNAWSETIDKTDFGLIAKRADLEQLEVLVVEVTPSAGHMDDEDVIRKVWDKWLGEMKVKSWKIVNSDLPAVTKQKVNSFLNTKN